MILVMIRLYQNNELYLMNKQYWILQIDKINSIISSNLFHYHVNNTQINQDPLVNKQIFTLSQPLIRYQIQFGFVTATISLLLLVPAK